MRVSNISFSSSVSPNLNTKNYDCNGCGKRKFTSLNYPDTYVRNIETDNRNLKNALRFACAIIAANAINL